MAESPERKKLESLLLGNHEKECGECRRTALNNVDQIEALYRPAPDAPMVERLKDIWIKGPRGISGADFYWLLATLEKLWGIGEKEERDGK